MPNCYKIHYDILQFNLYSDIILKAHYHISDKSTINITKFDDKTAEIILVSDELSKNELEKQFNYYLSKEKLKDILNKENHKIKELIVEQAFKPINNLRQELL